MKKNKKAAKHQKPNNNKNSNNKDAPQNIVVKQKSINSVV